VQNGSLFPHIEATENKASMTFEQWPGSKAYYSGGQTARGPNPACQAISAGPPAPLSLRNNLCM